jgi:hemerythrin-like domain-containing protein
MRLDTAQAATRSAANNQDRQTDPSLEIRMPKTPKKLRPKDEFVRPSMPALDALDAEHRQVMETLGDLAKLIESLDADGITPQTRASARQICDFFTTHARAHHAAEERLVFPSLLSSNDPTLVQHVLRLQQDHGWLEEDWLEIEPQLQAVATGISSYDLDMLRYALPVFEELYRDHIALEESLIYPEARRRQEQAALAAGARREGAA